MSHDDGQEVSGGGSPDIDHMVPLAEDPAHHVRVGVVDVKTSAELLLGELYAGEAGPWGTYRLYACDEFALYVGALWAVVQVLRPPRGLGVRRPASARPALFLLQADGQRRLPPQPLTDPAVLTAGQRSLRS
ncbi:hypothetical protein ACFY2N_07460 [Streptomyces rubiginosohelvolus]|uniref:hypothetical protein n=1 Tax=Streptomyces rubiginosohelvolus TaxID=67362 RepID=UPI00367D71DE